MEVEVEARVAELEELHGRPRLVQHVRIRVGDIEEQTLDEPDVAAIRDAKRGAYRTVSSL